MGAAGSRACCARAQDDARREPVRVAPRVRRPGQLPLPGPRDFERPTGDEFADALAFRVLGRSTLATAAPPALNMLEVDTEQPRESSRGRLGCQNALRIEPIGVQGKHVGEQGRSSEFRPYWVLLIDVLGVKDRICNAALRQGLLEAYRNSVKFAFENPSGTGILQRAAQYGPPDRGRQWDRAAWGSRVKIFSDSMFFFFDGELGDDRHRLTSPFWVGHFAAVLSRMLWREELPHRGALAYGECALDQENSIFLGPGIVRAFEYEQRQKWMGIALDPGSRAQYSGEVDGPRIFSEGSARICDHSAIERTLLLNVHAENVMGVWTAGQRGEPEEVIEGFNRAMRTSQGDGRLRARYEFTAQVWRSWLHHTSGLASLVAATS